MVHCPTCDAGLRFEIETQEMACDHCGNRFDVELTSDGENHDAKGHQLLDLYVFTCPDCGAELAVNDENDAVGFCPYCGGTSMLFDRVRQSWVPDGVIPFKITKEQCKQAYIKEVRRHPFVSRKYRNEELIDSFRGIYMPYWQFEGRQQTPYKVQGTETVDKAGTTVKIRRTFEQWYKTDYTITGFSHDASSDFDDHISERLAPYHDEKIERFHPGYLSGFYAEISDMNQETYTRYAKERCQDFTASQLSYSMTDSEKRSIETEISSLSNVLYPVWFMSYRRDDKISYAAVNGETGKVSADLPLSPVRIVLAAIVLTLVLFGVLNLFMRFLPSIKAEHVLTLCAVITFASTCFLNRSCLDTLNQSLRLEETQSPLRGDHAGQDKQSQQQVSGPFSFFNVKRASSMVIMSACAVLGTVLLAIDGSYSGSLRSWGYGLCFFGYGYLVAWAISQLRIEMESKDALRRSKASQLENGIAEAYLKYRILFNILKAVIYATCVIALCLGIGGGLDKFASYGLCIVLAIEVLVYAIAQIVFQVSIAERKPPQMSKEGAYYDAH